MKELSIKEKAKSYDEALERAKKWYNDPHITIGLKGLLEDIFPELKESEDERIKTAILNHLKKMWRNSQDDVCGIHVEDAIAWLEKQGKQKTIWHNEDEEPQRGSLILLIMQSGTAIVAKIIEPNHTFNHGERWAYIDDLLEKQGEKSQGKSALEAINEEKVDNQNCVKTADKAEPKFYVGMWLTENHPNNYARFVQIL